MPPPVGYGVRLLHVHFVCEAISTVHSLNKHGLSCLHVAIWEAGVQGGFDFSSRIQTKTDYIYSSSARGAYLTQV